MKIQKIKNRSVIFTYHIPEGWDLNIQLIQGVKNNYIVDTGLGSLSIAPVLDYIKNDAKPLIVINTHYHWDHIWGNHLLEDCTILSHKLCRENIKQNWDDMIQKKKQFINGDTKQCLPTMTFETEVFFPEDHIRVIYTPGHTIDSISVIDEEEKVINVADNIGDSMDEIIPNITCEMQQYINTLLRYKEMDFDTCLSGHNIVLGKDIIETLLKLVVNKI